MSATIKYLPTDIMNEIKGFMGLNCEKKCNGDCHLWRNDTPYDVTMICESNIAVEFIYKNEKMDRILNSTVDGFTEEKKKIRDCYDLYKKEVAGTYGSIDRLDRLLKASHLRGLIDINDITCEMDIKYIKKKHYYCDACLGSTVTHNFDWYETGMKEFAKSLIDNEKMPAHKAEKIAHSDFYHLDSYQQGFYKLDHKMKKIRDRYNIYKSICIKYLLTKNQIIVSQKKNLYADCCQKLKDRQKKI